MSSPTEELLMKSLFYTICLLMQGYRRSDRAMLEQDASIWEALHQQHLMRGDKEQASLCKREAEDKRRIMQQLC